jgi:hypothetical protein
MRKEVIEAVTHAAEHFAVRFFVSVKPVEETCPTTISIQRPARPARPHGSSSRIGAFEVQLALKMRTRQALSAHCLHSKLHTGCWPKVPGLQARALHLFEQAKFAQVKPLSDRLRRASSVHDRSDASHQPTSEPEPPATIRLTSRAQSRAMDAISSGRGAPVFDQRAEQVGTEAQEQRAEEAAVGRGSAMQATELSEYVEERRPAPDCSSCARPAHDQGNLTSHAFAHRVAKDAGQN